MTHAKGLPFFLLFLSLVFLSYAEVQCNNGLVNLCELRQAPKNGYTISLGDYDYTTNIAEVLNRTQEDCPGIQPSTISIQKLKGKKQCYSLGDLNYQVITFINPEDPSKGVKILYRGGTEGRSTTLVLPCDPSMVSAPAIKRITEPFRLNYEFEFYPLKAACPLITTANLPYTNDLTLHPANYKIFKVPVGSSIVSLKIELSLSVGDLATRATDDTMGQLLSRLGQHDIIGSSIFIHTRRGQIPTTTTHDYSTFISPSGNPNHRTLFIRGNPYLTAGDIYVSLYAGARIPPSVTVHFEVIPQNCISCNARGESDCTNQKCKCESPYIYEDCSGELKNITVGIPQTSEKVPNNFWTVYRFIRQQHQIFFNVILESTENDAPIVLVSQGTVPTIDNYLASDGYGQSRISYGGAYRIYGVKERHLSIEVDDNSDPNLYVGVFGGTILSQDSEGGVIDRTNVTDYKYSIVVESYACKNNCSGPVAGRCNAETHKCHCHSGYAGKSCSINSKQMSLGSSRDFVITPGNFEYFETTPKSDAFINISITSRDPNRPLKDVVIFVGDGYLPSSENFLASSHKPDQNEDFVGEIEVEEGDQITDDTLTGGADVIEDLRYSLQLLPRRKKVKYFIAVWNRDPVYHPMTLSLTEIDYKGGLGGVKAAFLSILMLLAGIILGAAMTVYRDHILVYIARAQGKLRTATSFIPLFANAPSFMPSTRFANVNPQPDDDDNIFTPDESDDVFE